jgi:hypothetical protein
MDATAAAVNRKQAEESHLLLKGRPSLCHGALPESL